VSTRTKDANGEVPSTAIPVVKKEIAPEAMTALGNSCLALSTAISELARAGFADETKELVLQLSLNSRSLRWLVRERNTEPSGNSSVDACAWMKECLANGQKLAAKVIEEGTNAGLSKSQIFKAREDLKLSISKKNGLQFWSLS
jgi:hypothetical protein